eukprot:Clim_evm56s214 gene=Clim_evmTU56s214
MPLVSKLAARFNKADENGSGGKDVPIGRGSITGYGTGSAAGFSTQRGSAADISKGTAASVTDFDTWRRERKALQAQSGNNTNPFGQNRSMFEKDQPTNTGTFTSLKDLRARQAAGAGGNLDAAAARAEALRASRSRTLRSSNNFGNRLATVMADDGNDTNSDRETSPIKKLEAVVQKKISRPGNPFDQSPVRQPVQQPQQQQKLAQPTPPSAPQLQKSKPAAAPQLHAQRSLDKIDEVKSQEEVKENVLPTKVTTTPKKNEAPIYDRVVKQQQNSGKKEQKTPTTTSKSSPLITSLRPTPTKKEVEPEEPSQLQKLLARQRERVMAEEQRLQQEHTTAAAETKTEEKVKIAAEKLEVRKSAEEEAVDALYDVIKEEEKKEVEVKQVAQITKQTKEIKISEKETESETKPRVQMVQEPAPPTEEDNDVPAQRLSGPTPTYTDDDMVSSEDFLSMGFGGLGGMDEEKQRRKEAEKAAAAQLASSASKKLTRKPSRFSKEAIMGTFKKQKEAEQRALASSLFDDSGPRTPTSASKIPAPRTSSGRKRSAVKAEAEMGMVLNSNGEVQPVRPPPPPRGVSLNSSGHSPMRPSTPTRTTSLITKTSSASSRTINASPANSNKFGSLRHTLRRNGASNARRGGSNPPMKPPSPAPSAYQKYGQDQMQQSGRNQQQNVDLSNPRYEKMVAKTNPKKRLEECRRLLSTELGLREGAKKYASQYVESESMRKEAIKKVFEANQALAGHLAEYERVLHRIGEADGNNVERQCETVIALQQAHAAQTAEGAKGSSDNVSTLKVMVKEIAIPLTPNHERPAGKAGAATPLELFVELCCYDAMEEDPENSATTVTKRTQAYSRNVFSNVNGITEIVLPEELEFSGVKPTSRFSFVIHLLEPAPVQPLRDTSHHAHDGDADYKNAPPSVPALPRGSIKIAEKDVSVRDMLGHYLHGNGHQAQCLISVKEWKHRGIITGECRMKLGTVVEGNLDKDQSVIDGYLDMHVEDGRQIWAIMNARLDRQNGLTVSPVEHQGPSNAFHFETHDSIFDGMSIATDSVHKCKSGECARMYSFVLRDLKNADREVYFSASSNKERNQWVRALNQYLRDHRAWGSARQHLKV